LDEKWNSKFGHLDEKLDSILAIFQDKNSSPRRSSESPSHRRKDSSPESVSQRHDISPERRSRRRHVSSQREKRSKFPLSIDSESENETNDDVLSLLETGSIFDKSSGDEESQNSDVENISNKTKKCLFEIFGEDATVKKTKKQEGICLDSSQIEVLENSFRSKTPNSVTAFAEDNYDLFPVDETTEKLLEVPPLDPLIESCLIKRHGSKASFSKTKSKSLVSQPSKMVEKIAYRGQQSARMGIVMNVYVQQSLANLLQFLESDSFEKTKAIQQVKDIFAMTTKSLDQVGRSGAFHHIVRRAVTMTDTGLYELEDASKFTNLPLSGDGLFGKDLESLLKSRKEMKKQMEDLVPDLSRKRKTYSKNSYDAKKQRLDTNKPNRSATSFTSREQHNTQWNSFKIPYVPKEGSRSRQSPPPSGRSRGSSFPRRGSGYRGRMGKPEAQ